MCAEEFRSQSTDEVLGAVMALHEQIIGLYKYLQGRAEVASTRALIDGLLSLEQHEAMRLMSQAHRLDDL